MQIFRVIFEIVWQEAFLVSFLSNFLASVLVAIFSVLVINKFTNIFKKPKLKFVVKQGGIYRDTVVLSKKIDSEDYEATFALVIKNIGNKNFKAGEGYWHTYIKTEVKNNFSVPGERNHQRDLIRHPIYPNSFFDLGIEYKISIKKNELSDTKVPYFFATEYGYFPKTIRLDIETGQVLFADMDYISFELLENFVTGAK